MISQQRDKRFNREITRLIKTPRQSANVSIDSKSIAHEQQPKKISVELNEVTKETIFINEERAAVNFTETTLNILRKWAVADKNYFKKLMLEKGMREETIKQQKRLSKIRNDRKFQLSSDCELSLAALNNILNLSGEIIYDITTLKSNSKTQNKFRRNQIHQMNKQLQIINQQIQLYNFAGVRFIIQELLKKFGKDEFLEQKIGYLSYIQWLTEEYEKQTGILNQVTEYLQKLSWINPSFESRHFSIQNLKKLKKQLIIAVNRENQKQQPNQRILTAISQVHRIQGTLLVCFQAKTFRTGVENQNKWESVPKQQDASNKNGQCQKQYLLQKGRGIKQDESKLPTDKRAKSPHHSITKIQEYAVNLKRQLAQTNLYLKTIAISFQKHNLFGQHLTVELRKCYEKYQNNYLIVNIRANLQKIIHSIQQKERSAKQSFMYQNQVKRVKKENQKLKRILEQLNNQSHVPQQAQNEEVFLEQQIKSSQILYLQKEEEMIDQHINAINTSLSSKKWNESKKLINIFNQKCKESSNPMIIKYLQNMNAILIIVESCEDLLSQLTKKQEKVKQIEAQLNYSEQQRQIQRGQGQNRKCQWDQIRIQQINIINQLSAEIEITKKNQNELSNQYKADIENYRQLNSKLKSASNNEEGNSQQMQQYSVNKGTLNELPKLLAEERERCLSQFMQVQLPSIILSKQDEWQSNNQYIIDTILSEQQRILEEERAQDRVTFDKILQREKDISKSQLEQQKRHWMLQKSLQQKQWQKTLQCERKQFQKYKQQYELKLDTFTDKTPVLIKQQKQKQAVQKIEIQQIQDKSLNSVMAQRQQQQIRFYQNQFSQLSQLQTQLNSNRSIISKYQLQVSQNYRKMEEAQNYYKEQIDQALDIIQSLEKDKINHKIEVQKLQEQIIKLIAQAEDSKKISRMEIAKSNQLQSQLNQFHKNFSLYEIDKIKKQINELQQTKRHLQQKIMEVQQRQRNRPISDDLTSFKHFVKLYSNPLVNDLFQEKIIFDIQIYQSFLNKLEKSLIGDSFQEYLICWKQTVSKLIRGRIVSLSSQIQSQAQQIFGLKAEIKETLNKQKQNRDSQLVIEYISVLRDIKKMARSYKQTGDHHSIESLYTCLGIK